MGIWTTLRSALAKLSRAKPRPLGEVGEREAARVLKRSGFEILGTNLKFGGNANGHGAWGEIDILALDPDKRTIVVVEVKSRRRAGGGTGKSAEVAPEASVTAAKRRKLLRLMDAVVRANRWMDRPKRIDVVAVEFVETPGGADAVHTRHIVDAVRRTR